MCSGCAANLAESVVLRVLRSLPQQDVGISKCGCKRMKAEAQFDERLKDLEFSRS